MGDFLDLDKLDGVFVFVDDVDQVIGIDPNGCGVIIGMDTDQIWGVLEVLVDIYVYFSFGVI